MNMPKLMLDLNNAMVVQYTESKFIFTFDGGIQLVLTDECVKKQGEETYQNFLEAVNYDRRN